MAQSALFVAIFFGLAIIWERDAGQLQRLLATPLPRLAIVLGKASGAGVRALVQAACCWRWSRLRGIRLDWEVWRVLGALVSARARHRRLRLPVDVARLAAEDARALHGHRPDGDDAALLRLERSLPALDHAALAASHRAGRIRSPTRCRACARFCSESAPDAALARLHGLRRLLPGACRTRRARLPTRDHLTSRAEPGPVRDS